MQDKVQGKVTRAAISVGAQKRTVKHAIPQVRGHRNDHARGVFHPAIVSITNSRPNCGDEEDQSNRGTQEHSRATAKLRCGTAEGTQFWARI